MTDDHTTPPIEHHIATDTNPITVVWVRTATEIAAHVTLTCGCEAIGGAKLAEFAAIPRDDWDRVGLLIVMKTLARLALEHSGSDSIALLRWAIESADDYQRAWDSLVGFYAETHPEAGIIVCE